MKKNFIATTLAVLIGGCTTTYTPSKLEIWAKTQAQQYPKEAQIAYLTCDYQWPNHDCKSKNLKTFGFPTHPNYLDKSQNDEQLVKHLLTFIDAMAMHGAKNVLQNHKFQCNDITYFDDLIFTTSKKAICDNGIEYKMKPKGTSWRIEVISQPQKGKEND